MAGPLAAATASTVTNPMDVVRARVQVISVKQSKIRQPICIAGMSVLTYNKTDDGHKAAYVK